VTNLYDSALQPAGVRSTQFAILVAVARSQPVSIGNLSQLLLSDRTTLTRSLALMEKDGLLRISERSTMRQRFVTLSDKGRRLVARSAPLWRKVQERYVAAIGAERWKRLQRELERLSNVAVLMEKSRRGSRKRVEEDLCN
jgi:DNA-binding MarR family transcriptional regulator